MKILIAEDELVSRKKMEKLLRSLGHEILVAKHGTEAWEIWKNERTRMVITDWMMPGMDGPDLCRKIRESEGSRYTYLIMVTAKQEVNDMVTGMDAGADDFISKPFVKEELAVRIRSGQRILGFETRDIVIFSLAKLAESRDSETGNHLERVRFYSKTVAEALALSDNGSHKIDNLFIENIFLTSPLHDIGKVGIRDHILLKPGRLTDEEFEAMKSHTIIGFETLNDALNKYPKAEYLRMSAEIARSHHERFDGKGYPDGLSGENIPLSARIVALADVYDALVSKRVYKDAFSHDKSKSIITGDSGTHFDPVVVDAFLSCEKKFIQIYEKFKD
ncbi:response regulator [Desulfonema magnum]|uniref:Two component system response regulator, HD domain-containing n=1 Tax=Desulfonema magnum TaxID=45655 RepID=A0A975GTD0_9BACT|nr:HD domain-containing phosphohydrolase [Desulfonema magnum]QTA92008.1 Two component system response regulator, HD domain-containing [Desulfonema magnum]